MLIKTTTILITAVVAAATTSRLIWQHPPTKWRNYRLQKKKTKQGQVGVLMRLKRSSNKSCYMKNRNSRRTVWRQCTLMCSSRSQLLWKSTEDNWKSTASTSCSSCLRICRKILSSLYGLLRLSVVWKAMTAKVSMCRCNRTSMNSLTWSAIS